MSQTEEAATTQNQANELAALSIDQLKQLKDEQTDDTAAAALQAVIDEREKLESLTTGEAKTKKEPGEKKSRKGSRAPRGRQVTAAATFNADPANLLRLKAIMEDPDEPVVQPDGSYRMTPRLIQSGISAYYDERRRESAGSEPKSKKQTETATEPIIPAAEAAPATDPVQPAAPVADDSTSTTSEAEASAPAEVTEGAGEAPLDLGQVEAAGTATPPLPINPYGSDEPDDE